MNIVKFCDLLPGAEPTPRTQENFRKLSNIFLRKVQNCIIFAYFTQNFTSPALTFAGFDEKHHALETFEKTLKIYDENSIEKLTF